MQCESNVTQPGRLRKALQINEAKPGTKHAHYFWQKGETMITATQYQITIEATNLDALNTPDELRAIQGSVKELQAQLQAVANYAEMKAYAVQCRLEGKIAKANRFEIACESVYHTLPTWAKW